MANSIPNTFNLVTGFPKIKRDTAITNILLEALATAYVKGVTIDNTLKAIIFCSQLRTPSVNNSIITL